MTCLPKTFLAKHFCRKRSNDYPRVTDKYKAFHVRIMALWALDWFSEQMDPDDQYDNMRFCCLHFFNEMQEVFDSNGVLLTNEHSERAFVAGKRFLLTYQALAAFNMRLGRTFYKITPKFHFMWHMLIQMQETNENPRCQACWIEEDLMGKVRWLGKSLHPRTLMLRLIQRWDEYCYDRWDRMGPLDDEDMEE